MDEGLKRYVHDVHVPGDVEPAAWLAAAGYASVSSPPRPLPTGWPESQRACLMVIYRDCPDLNHDCRTHAKLVTRPEAMKQLANGNTEPQLWFVLPRHLFTEEICPTLRPEDWPEGSMD
jgi:hypothetical protein